MSALRNIRSVLLAAAGILMLCTIQGFTPRKNHLQGNLRLPSHSLDTIPKADTTAVKDSLGRDSVFVVDSSLISTLKQPVFSTGRDSSVEILTDGKRMLYYYGDVTVNYEDISIKADYIAYNVQTRTVFAKGLPDSTGVVKGHPELKEGKNTYTMESVYYNFDTKKAKKF